MDVYSKCKKKTATADRLHFKILHKRQKWYRMQTLSKKMQMPWLYGMYVPYIILTYAKDNNWIKKSVCMQMLRVHLAKALPSECTTMYAAPRCFLCICVSLRESFCNLHQLLLPCVRDNKLSALAFIYLWIILHLNLLPPVVHSRTTPTHTRPGVLLLCPALYVQ